MKPVKLPLINIDKIRKTAIVISRNGRRFPVKISMPTWKINDVEIGDDAIVTKSAVTGEWLMIDFSIMSVSNIHYHNTVNLEANTGDLIYDEAGDLI